MNPRNLLLAIAGVSGLLIGLWFGRHSPTEKIYATSAVAESAATAASGASAAAAAPPAPALAVGSSPTSKALAIPPATRERITACLEKSGRPPGSGALESLEALLSGFAATNAPAAELPELLDQNIHVRKPDGQVLRLRIVPSEARERRVRLFSVDGEGLPVPEALPDTLATVPVGEALARFRAMGELVFESRKTSHQFAGGLSANVTEENGRVVEMQVFFTGGSLGCAWQQPESTAPALDCRCL